MLTPEYLEFYNEIAFPQTPTPLPAPIIDSAEYYHLAAYARFRIMLIYVLLGSQVNAKVAYNSLQAGFPKGQTGHSYAEMATAFWQEYQSSSDIQLACGKAVEYAIDHDEEILPYLGNVTYLSNLLDNYYHGWQNIDYLPKDVCPFGNK